MIVGSPMGLKMRSTKMRHFLAFSICLFIYNFFPCKATEETNNLFQLGTVKGSVPKFYFEYQTTETRDSFRKTAEDELTRNLIEQEEFTKHITMYEECTDLTELQCHKYALCKIFGYTEIPSWIRSIRDPKKFFNLDLSSDFLSTNSIKNGDLIVYFADELLTTPKHFGVVQEEEGETKVISTWGYKTFLAVKHTPFFIPLSYGKYAIVYTTPEKDIIEKLKEKMEGI